MARGDLTPQEIKLRKTISNNINFLLKSKKRTILSYRSFFVSFINFVKSVKSSDVAFNLMKLLAVDRLLRYVARALFFSLYRLLASACCSGVEYAFFFSVTTSPPFTYHSISDSCDSVNSSSANIAAIPDSCFILKTSSASMPRFFIIHWSLAPFSLSD